MLIGLLCVATRGAVVAPPHCSAPGQAAHRPEQLYGGSDATALSVCGTLRRLRGGASVLDSGLQQFREVVPSLRGLRHRGGATICSVVKQLDERLNRKDHSGALKLVVSDVEWVTPSWRAASASELKKWWDKDVDAKWGVRPEWLPLSRRADTEAGLLVYERECIPFRVLMVTIRLRQTFWVGKGKIHKCTIERL